MVGTFFQHYRRPEEIPFPAGRLVLRGRYFPLPLWTILLHEVLWNILLLDVLCLPAFQVR